MWIFNIGPFLNVSRFSFPRLYIKTHFSVSLPSQGQSEAAHQENTCEAGTSQYMKMHFRIYKNNQLIFQTKLKIPAEYCILKDGLRIDAWYIIDRTDAI